MTEGTERASVEALIQSNLDKEPDILPADPSTTAAPAVEATPPTPEPAVAPEQTATPEPTSVEASSPAPVDKDYQDFIGKYGGDQTKAAKAYWESTREAARLARENEELKAKIQTPPATPTVAPEPTAPPVAPPELARFDGDLRAYEDSYTKIQTKEAEYTTERDKVSYEAERKQAEIDRLAHSLATGRVSLDKEDAAKERLASLYEERDEFRRQAGNYNAWIEKFQQDKASLSRDWRYTKALRDQQESLLAIRARETEDKERKDKERYDRFGQTFFTTLRSVAKEGKGDEIIPDDEFQDFDQFARREALLALTGPNSDLEKIDIPAFQRKVKADYLAWTDRSHKRRSARYTQLKVADSQIGAPEGQRAVAEPTKRTGFRSKAEVDAAIDAALG